jgi:zinc D-Ala-D-Ala dipeptidase
MKLFCTLLFLTALPVILLQVSFGQQKSPPVIQNEKGYQKSISGKPDFKMVDLGVAVPGIVFDIRYASTNNFLHQKIYPPISTTYCRKKTAEALAAVQNELKEKGLGLKIFDAYRPYEATKKIWNLIKDERYAANPSKGSNHNRGIAVDVTLINLNTKEELNMGTGFDNFSDTAHHGFTSLPVDVLQNRLLLKTVMTKNGFEFFETEWWHYTLTNAKEYDLLGISFKQLEKLTTRY